MLKKIKESSNYILGLINNKPEVGIILGSGLGGLVNDIEIQTVIPYENIPHFPISTVEGHSGKLIFGKLSGKDVVAMQGRFHYYEGYSLQEVTFPVRVLNAIGIEKLFLSNASGGMNPEFEVGDLMVITDQINMLPGSPLIGKHYQEWGQRFVDMSEPYDNKLIDKALRIGEVNGLNLKTGVYVATCGPNFETPAEYKWFRYCGADAVGMSTVPEVIVARQLGIACFAVSIITDLGIPGIVVKVSHEEVLKEANKAEKKMTFLFKALLNEI